MYDRNRRSSGNRGNRTGRPRRSRERTPPRQRSPIPRLSRERSRPRVERNRSNERFHRKPRDAQETRFTRTLSSERFEPPHQFKGAGRFEPPPQDNLDHQRTFENERYIPPSPRFEERGEAIEPPVVERKLNFECPTDYNKYPGEGRFFDGPTLSTMDTAPGLASEVAPSFEKDENNDKPDPWNNVSQTSSQLQPTFGQEKGSTLIPEFDPETSDLSVSAFLRLTDKIGQEKGWSSHDRKFQFSMKLRGSAKDWFVNGNKFLESWSSIKKQFKTNFPDDMDYYAMLTNMLERTKRPDEDLSSYFNYKIVLLRNCNITGRKAVSCLIGGLSDSLREIKTNALDKNFASAEELYKFLIDENIEDVETEENNRKCSSCGKMGQCDCRKSEPKIIVIPDEAPRPKTTLKCYKDIFIGGQKLKCLFDEEFPHNTIRESDIDFIKIRYRRQITIINGYDRSNITALGHAQFMVRVDNLFTEMPFYVVKDSIQDTPVILGRVGLKFPHITNRNGIFFTADEERPEQRDRLPLELGRSRSPLRRGGPDFSLRRGSPPRSPRRSPPGRLYKESSLFLSQFYGNPYA